MARNFRAAEPTVNEDWVRMFSHLEDGYDFGFNDDEPFVATTPLDAGGAAKWLHAAKTRQRSRAFRENRHRAQYHDYLGRRPKLQLYPTRSTSIPPSRRRQRNTMRLKSPARATSALCGVAA